jgi:hypothetical protein
MADFVEFVVSVLWYVFIFILCVLLLPFIIYTKIRG